MYDVVIVGCGIVGAAAAYELSKYSGIKVAVLERFNDVANGTTKANSAVIHAGFDPQPRTMMAKLNHDGRVMAKELCEKLDVEYRSLPTMVIAFDDFQMNELENLRKRGIENGVEDIRIISREEVLEKEPNLNPDVKGALYTEVSGIVNPWEYAIALSETAVRNGVEVHLSSEVTAINKKDDYFEVITTKGSFETKYIINAAGCFSDVIHEMVGGKGFTNTNYCGEYYVFDKSQGKLVNSIIFPCPDEKGFKGVLVVPTVHGNLLVGPDAFPVETGDSVGVHAEYIQRIKELGLKSVPSINFKEIIRQYAGVRPTTDGPDFIIGESEYCKNFINLAGIKSPGLTSAPAIALMCIDILKECGLKPDLKESYVDSRKHIRFSELSDDEKRELIKSNPLYGRVVCRCETVTEGEILDALKSPIVPTTVDAIKRRTSAGLGRCQGGFCGPKVHEILARELKLPLEEITMDEAGSSIVVGYTKEDYND